MLDVIWVSATAGVRNHITRMSVTVTDRVGMKRKQFEADFDF